MIEYSFKIKCDSCGEETFSCWGECPAVVTPPCHFQEYAFGGKNFCGKCREAFITAFKEVIAKHV